MIWSPGRAATRASIGAPVTGCRQSGARSARGRKTKARPVTRGRNPPTTARTAFDWSQTVSPPIFFQASAKSRIAEPPSPGFAAVARREGIGGASAEKLDAELKKFQRTFNVEEEAALV